MQIEVEGGRIDSKVLFKKAMTAMAMDGGGDWNDLVNMYRNYPLARSAKVTRAKNTVLHLAVLNEDDNLVEQLVNTIKEEEAHHLLSLQNNLGNTPLHVAASLGLPKICWLLAEKCKELVVMARNTDGETPLYVAASHGKMMTFFVLQDFVPETILERTFRFCQRDDGNTILHAAVHGEYFGLAIEIITLYPKLVNFYNKIGQTPLHLLANMPLAFRSGSRLGEIDRLNYSRIIVDRLEPKYKPRIYEGQLNGWKKEKEINMPKDYATIMNLFQLLHHICRPINKGQSNENLERDEENGCHVRPTKKIQEKLIITGSKFLMTALNILAGAQVGRTKVVYQEIDVIKREKIKHEHASQVMEALVQGTSYWEYGEDGKLSNGEQKQDEIAITTIKPQDEESSASESSIGKIMQTKNLKKVGDKKANEPIQEKQETPILIAAKQGVVEMVKSILDNFPEAVQDFDSKHKNIVLLSAEHRQMQVYKYLLDRKSTPKSIFGMVDMDGNTALHLVARHPTTNHPWLLISKNKAIQMHQEYKLYKVVENSMERGFFRQYNSMGETAMGIFSNSHESLVKEGGKWLTNTSQFCSVVAVLVAGVAYASVTTVPGGLDPTSGFPILAKKLAFKMFAWSALAALHISILALIMFLSLLTSSYQETEFRRNLLMKVHMALDLLFVSIATMLLSFINGFIAMEYKNDISYAALLCPPVAFFGLIGFMALEFPVYYELLSSIVDLQ